MLLFKTYPILSMCFQARKQTLGLDMPASRGQAFGERVDTFGIFKVAVFTTGCDRWDVLAFLRCLRSTSERLCDFLFLPEVCGSSLSLFYCLLSNLWEWERRIRRNLRIPAQKFCAGNVNNRDTSRLSHVRSFPELFKFVRCVKSNKNEEGTRGVWTRGGIQEKSHGSPTLIPGLVSDDSLAISTEWF